MAPVLFAAAALVVGLAYFGLRNSNMRSEVGPTEFDGWWRVPDAKLDRVVDEIASAYLRDSMSFASFSESQMKREIAEFEANPMVFLRKRVREDIDRCIVYFGPGADSQPQYFEYRPNGSLRAKLQWIQWRREGVSSIQTYQFRRKLYRWEQVGSGALLHDRFPVPLPLERLHDQNRRPEDRVKPLDNL